MATKKANNSNSNFDLAAYLEGSAPTDKSKLSLQNSEEIISQPAEPSRPSQPAEKPTEPLSISAKRISQKQRKASLEEYKNIFLNPPKITDRKKVYLSAETPTYWTKLSADWASEGAAFRIYRKYGKGAFGNLRVMKLTNGKGCSAALMAFTQTSRHTEQAKFPMPATNFSN